MRRTVRPWVFLVCVGVVALSLAVHWRGVKKGSGVPISHDAVSDGRWKPPEVSTFQAGGSEPRGLVRRQPKELEEKAGKPAVIHQKWDPEIWGILPPRSRVMLEDGSVVPAKPGRSKLGDPGVMAEIYDGAPEVAVKRLKGILLSGSNEYAEFTRTEKYPEWVYDEIESRYPGSLGRFLAYMARFETTMDPSVRTVPVLDISDDAMKDGYTFMAIGLPGEIPVAETKFGIVGAERTLGVGAPSSYAAFLAHRIASGQHDFHTPKIPPPGNRSFEHWVRDYLGPELVKDLEDAGILPRRKNWHAAPPGNGASPQAVGHE